MVAALLLISTFFVSLLGQDSLRAAKSFFLYLPFGIFIFWGLKKKDIGCFSRVFVWIATSIFYIDGIVRYFLKEAYGASPESSLVLEAAANTNIRESAEYLFANSVRFLILGSGLLALMLFSGKLLMIAPARAGHEEYSQLPTHAAALNSSTIPDSSTISLALPIKQQSFIILSLSDMGLGDSILEILFLSNLSDDLICSSVMFILSDILDSTLVCNPE